MSGKIYEFKNFILQICNKYLFYFRYFILYTNNTIGTPLGRYGKSELHTVIGTSFNRHYDNTRTMSDGR